MNGIKERIFGYCKAMSPISATLLKMYIPIILTLVSAIAVLGILYAAANLQSRLDLLLDCVQALKSTFGIAIITLIVSRVISR